MIFGSKSHGSDQKTYQSAIAELDQIESEVTRAPPYSSEGIIKYQERYKEAFQRAQKAALLLEGSRAQRVLELNARAHRVSQTVFEPTLATAEGDFSAKLKPGKTRIQRLVRNVSGLKDAEFDTTGRLKVRLAPDFKLIEDEKLGNYFLTEEGAPYGADLLIEVQNSLSKVKKMSKSETLALADKRAARDVREKFNATLEKELFAVYSPRQAKSIRAQVGKPDDLLWRQRKALALLAKPVIELENEIEQQTAFRKIAKEHGLSSQLAELLLPATKDVTKFQNELIASQKEYDERLGHFGQDLERKMPIWAASALKRYELSELKAKLMSKIYKGGAVLYSSVRETQPGERVLIRLLHVPRGKKQKNRTRVEIQVQNPLGNRIEIPRDLQNELQKFVEKNESGEFSFFVRIPLGSPTGLYTARVVLDGVSADDYLSPREAIAENSGYVTFRVREAQAVPEQALTELRSKVGIPNRSVGILKQDAASSDANSAR